MEMNTNVLHKRILFKHKHLMFRINYPKTHKLFMLFLILTLAGTAAYTYVKLFAKNQNTIYTDQFNIDIKTYSLNGEVISASSTNLSIKTGIIETENGANKIVFIEKEIQITAATEVVKIKLSEGKVNSSAVSALDLAVGQSIAVYTSNNPSKSEIIEAEKIEILEE